jgi:hypothetical protein
MSKKRKGSKSSKAANIARRLVMIANGMGQAKETSPTFELVGKRLVKKYPAKQTDPELDDEEDLDCDALYQKYGK